MKASIHKHIRFSTLHSKPFITFCLILLLTFLSIFPVHATTTGYVPEIVAPRAVLMDAETGTVLFSKNAGELTFPASTTKVLTALVVLEHASLDDVVAIDYEPGVTGSSMYIVPGEAFTVETLLKGLLIRSANDAAEILARHVSGSVEAFVALMNQHAAAIGAVNTHFTNPHGLPDENHVTTAYDLALISREAMKNDFFREVVASPSLVIAPTSETEQRVYNNSNRFLWGKGPSHQMIYQGNYTNIYYEPVDGIKTGYTHSARNCLISSAVFNNDRYIAVVLNAEQESIYADSRTLLDYGFQFFHRIHLVENGSQLAMMPVMGGDSEAVALVADTTLQQIVPRNVLPSDVRMELLLPEEDLAAPLAQNEILGQVQYFYEDELLGQANLITQNAIEEVPPIFQQISWGFYGPAALIVLFILWQVFVFYLRQKKRKQRRMQRARRYQQYESLNS